VISRPRARAILQIAFARASYDVMLSGNDAIAGTGGLGLGGTFRGVAYPNHTWSLGFDEEFLRLIRAANFETDADTNRDINTFALNVLYHPVDRSYGGYLYYNNSIDVFERSQQQFADRFQNKFGIHPLWRWLPQTTIYADVSEGVYSGLGANSKKVTSFPLNAVAGVATLLSVKTTLNFQAGYTNGFYSSGPNFSGLLIGAALGYRYSPLGRVTLTYDLQYQDSINANFYRDHVIRLWVQQLMVPFVLMAQPEIHFRQYNGITVPGIVGATTRDDVIFSVIAGAHYNFRNSFAATLDYHFSQVSTDYRYMTAGASYDPSFARHELLLGVRLAL
jgi:opacity protein-like surface antigen